MMNIQNYLPRVLPELETTRTDEGNNTELNSLEPLGEAVIRLANAEQRPNQNTSVQTTSDWSCMSMAKLPQQLVIPRFVNFLDKSQETAQSHNL
jgi:hypothetical protein